MPNINSSRPDRKKVDGLDSHLFLKVGAPLEVIGRAAEKLKIRKPTHIGLNVVFDWERSDAFTRQPMGDALFSWTERHQCLMTLINTAEGHSDTGIKLLVPGKGDLEVKLGQSLMKQLKEAGVVKEVFPLHQEQQRKWLLEHWSFNWIGFTSQPLDAIYAYFGPKVAIYFAFLGMYTRWLLFPAILGIYFYKKDMGKWEPAVPTMYSMVVVVWAVLFLQFWRRSNAEILTRWGISNEHDKGLAGVKSPSPEQQDSLFRGILSETQLVQANVSKQENRVLEKEEWLSRLISLRNNAIVISAILCLQLPFELLYAHLNRIASYSILKFTLTGIYIMSIQYFTKKGGQVALKLTKTQNYSYEAAADSIIYKVFGIYFMQSYIGLFYQAFFHQDFDEVRQMLAQRLIVSQLISNVAQNLVPYLTYRYAKYKAFQADQEHKKTDREKVSESQASWVEKEYLKPAYKASITSELEDGLFDDFLELAVQFGMVTMFASAFPLVAAFALINNLVEIRSDSLKLLVTMRRPVPHTAATIGAWLAIFQNLGVVAIITNCALLVCLYDDAKRWKMEPGLAAILILEHLLLLAKFGFSWFVPEEPAWIKAKRIKQAHVHDVLSHQMLKSFDPNKERSSTNIDFSKDIHATM